MFWKYFLWGGLIRLRSRMLSSNESTFPMLGKENVAARLLTQTGSSVGEKRQRRYGLFPFPSMGKVAASLLADG